MDVAPSRALCGQVSPAAATEHEVKQEEAREAAVAARGCKVGDDERARGGGVARSTRRAAEALWLATSQSNWTGLQLQLSWPACLLEQFTRSVNRDFDISMGP